MRDGLAGLLPGKRGPKGPSKLTPQVTARIRELAADGSLSQAEIGRRCGVSEFAVRTALGRGGTGRAAAERVPPENSQQVLVAFGGHETCPRPVLGGLAWRIRWPRRGWRARVCCPAAVPRRGVLSLRVYRAVVLVSGPGSPRTGVHGRD
jgi:hypothetical protein